MLLQFPDFETISLHSPGQIQFGTCRRVTFVFCLGFVARENTTTTTTTTTTTRGLTYPNAHAPSEVLQTLDRKTRARLHGVTTIEHIKVILEQAGFVSRARCLRHSLKPGGCELPRAVDIVS